MVLTRLSDGNSMNNYIEKYFVTIVLNDKRQEEHGVRIWPIPPIGIWLGAGSHIFLE